MASMNLPESNTSLTYTKPSSQPHLTHTPIPTPNPNEVLVKIKAAAINPVDIQLWGNPVVGWLAGTKEKGIGRDYSGEIVAIGSAVKETGKWDIGDEVFGLCNRPVCHKRLSHTTTTNQMRDLRVTSTSTSDMTNKKRWQKEPSPTTSP